MRHADTFSRCQVVRLTNDDWLICQTWLERLSELTTFRFWRHSLRCFFCDFSKQHRSYRTATDVACSEICLLFFDHEPHWFGTPWQQCASGIMTVQQSRMRRLHWSNVLSVPPSLQRMLEAPPRLQWTIPPRSRTAAIQHKLLTNSDRDHDCDSNPCFQGFINSETAVRPEHAGRTQFFEGLLRPR